MMERCFDIQVVRQEKARIIGTDAPEQTAACLLQPEKEVYVVFDRNVAAVAEALVPAARARLGIDASEAGKTLETVLEIVRWLLSQHATRDALLVAVGGGITTDMAGFAASIYKRGIRYANIPTTLLAQVDAAVGGKTGVNLDGYKNMLGVICQPVWTLLSAKLLETLPRREYLCGVAELLKTFLLADGDVYRRAVAALQAGEDLQEAVFAAAHIKAGIVQADPFENGERRKLNLGHTFAHAIEHEARLRGDDILHGEAVAIGILLAARLADRLRLSSGGESRLRADFRSCGLPLSCPYSLWELAGAMAQDKKAAGESVHFVLPIVPGEVIIKDLSIDQVLFYLNDSL